SVPRSMVCLKDLYTSFGSLSLITSSLNTRLPNNSGTLLIISFLSPFIKLDIKNTQVRSGILKTKNATDHCICGIPVFLKYNTPVFDVCQEAFLLFLFPAQKNGV